MTSQVAVGDNADDASVFVENTGKAEPFLGDLGYDIFHRSGAAHARHSVAGVHDLLDAQELESQLAFGVECFEIVLGEAFFFQHRHRERVS